MKFKYVGPHDAVELVGHGEVKSGSTVDVTGDAAKSLEAQDTWKRVIPPKPRKPKTPAKSANENEE